MASPTIANMATAYADPFGTLTGVKAAQMDTICTSIRSAGPNVPSQCQSPEECLTEARIDMSVISKMVPTQMEALVQNWAGICESNLNGARKTVICALAAGMIRS